jgi:hypothetical protein
VDGPLNEGYAGDDELQYGAFGMFGQLSDAKLHGCSLETQFAEAEEHLVKCTRQACG